ncbi:serine/threonine-protein phosphatase 2A regulatory subunit B'' subunit alpha isoform X2 [Ambystoma mexicanum]|uniref:serine/threonine-protein phosphatase 2A regulatory subunit B'' subunit alpha isoform X2 n=1 Tax=Ambystoma mexicanum TaxID=8296 RepID=UPI0037E950CE
MMIKEASLRLDPDLRGELAFLARGCDFVLPSRFKKRIKSFQQAQVQSRQEKKPGTPPPAPVIPVQVPRPASPPPPVNHVIVSAPIAINIPRFYFPKGLPNPCSIVDESLSRAEAAFAELEDEKADIYEMGKIAKVCGCPLYWKAPMFNAAGGERTGFVSVHSFIAMWRKLLQSCHDDASRFIHLLAKPGCNYLEQEDFIPLLQDVVDAHPGLTFLKDAPEFHSRYITTVIQRIFYTVNRSWSGRITLTEMRRSNFLQTLALLEEEDDINQITDYFSYEHFYVIYCKFWELDTDHDLYIDKKDLARYNDHASSNRIIERIFSGAVTRGNTVQKEGKMSYADFVWFLISEEDKKNSTSIEYWYRCMDMDGDGVLSMYEMEYFYEEQCERMEAMGIEPLPFHDLLCQTLDLVKPQCAGKITLRDLKRCRMAHIFYDTCFNLEKYLDHEQRDPFAVQKDVENDGPEPSDWDRYAAEEYEILVAEESANDQLQEGSFEDDYETDELISPPENGSKMDAIVISDLSA